MHIHPELRALRGDDSPQRLAQSAAHDAMLAWHARPEVAAVLADVTAFAAGGALADHPALAAILGDGGAARDFVGGFSKAFTDLVSAHPLAHVPQRHAHDGVQSTLLLAVSGTVTLSLVAIDGFAAAGQPPAKSASFWPGEAWEHVLAGSADAETVECDPTDSSAAPLHCTPLRLAPGSRIARDAVRQSLVLRRIDGTLVSLRLQRRQRQAGPTREYDLASGKLVHLAAGNPRDSRIELMMAMLGRMGRADAAPLMAEIARESGPEALRWQALRECLGLDTATGFAALGAIARDSADPLAAPAGALRAQLIETYPQLASHQPCPM